MSSRRNIITLLSSPYTTSPKMLKINSKTSIDNIFFNKVVLNLTLFISYHFPQFHVGPNIFNNSSILKPNKYERV